MKIYQVCIIAFFENHLEIKKKNDELILFISIFLQIILNLNFNII